MSILSAESFLSIDGSSSVFTNSTTQSSRRRHPGAAKNRLARAKEAESKTASRKNGWHESMEAAAAVAHREWKPQEGWTDYRETKEAHFREDTSTPAASEGEKIHIPLHVFAKRSKNKKNKTNSHDSGDEEKNGSDIFFQVAWEKDSKEVINPLPSSPGAAEIKSSRIQSNNRGKTNPRGKESSLQWDHKQNYSPATRGTPSNKMVNAQKENQRQQKYSQDEINEHASPVFWDLAMPRHASPSRSPPRRQRPDIPRSPVNGQKLPGRSRNEYPSSSARRSQAVFRERRVQSLSPPRRNQLSDRQNSLSKPPRAVGDQPISPLRTRSKGWVESMRIATANLASDGHSWDPKHGFANLDNASVSDVISVGSASNGKQQPTRQRRHEQQDQQQRQRAKHPRKTTPAEVLSKMIAERQKNDPPGRKSENPETSHSTSRDIEPNYKDNSATQAHRDNHVSDDQGEQNPQKRERGEDQQSTIQEQIEVVMLNRGTSSPVKTHNYGIAALNFEEDEDYILQAPTTLTPNVAVKKERVGDEDLGLFPKSTRRDNPASLPKKSSGSPEANNASKKVVPRSSTRRSSGPVDVDEVDTMSSDTTDEASNVWDSGEFENDSFLQGSISSRKSNKKLTKVGVTNRESSTGSPLVDKKTIAWSSHAKQLTQNMRSNSEVKVNREKASGKYLALIDGDRTKPESNYANFRDKYSVAPLPSKIHSRSPQTGASVPEEGKQAKSRIVPKESATDNASHLSTPSSVTAGWKSFLNKKVQAESVAAANLQKQMHETESLERGANEGIVKKSVSFENDSLLSDSLLDSLFDFSTSDIKSHASSEKTKRPVSFESTNPPPYQSSRLRGNVLHSPGRDNTEECSNPASQSFEEAVGPPVLSRIRSREIEGDSPQQPQNHSFNKISQLSGEEKESTVVEDSKEPSFFKRIAECRAPLIGKAPALNRRGQTDLAGSQEEPVAYQWYMQSKRASARVEEMMAILRSRGPISSCASRGRNGASIDTTQIVDPDSKKAYGVAPGQEAQKLTKADSKDPDMAAVELARARVDAMVDTLYYAPDERKT